MNQNPRRALSELKTAAWIVAGVLSLGALSAHGATSGADTSAAAKPEPRAAAMQARLQLLQNKIDAMESQESQSSKDLAAAIDRVLAESDRQSKLLSVQGYSSGYSSDRGFVLQSDDGSFALHPSALFQFRNMTSYRDSIPPGGAGEVAATGSDTTTGFEVSRLQLAVDGSLFTPNLTYFLQTGYTRGVGTFNLLDAYATWRVSDQSPVAIKFGQFKDPLWHEQNLYESNLLAVDRSLVDAFLGGGQTGRVEGAGMVYDEDRLRGQAIVHNGYASANTKFFDAGGMGAAIGSGGGVTPTNFGITARGEYLLIGSRTPEFNPFSEYDQFTSLGAKMEVLVVGAGVDWSEAGASNIYFHTVDAQYNNPGGLSVYAAYLGGYRDLTHNAGTPKGHYYDSGALIQAGYLLSSQFELFGRYDYTHLDGTALPSIGNDNLHELTIGANYYLKGQHAKITIDGSWLPNGSPTDVDSLGILKDDNHNEFMLRAQVQLQI